MPVLREGPGDHVFPDGGMYSGNWKENKRNGKGVYTYPRYP
jgi:hypothetical protein